MATAAKKATLAAALVAAQNELHAPTKNRTVKVRSDKGNYSFDYATLDSIVESLLRPVLPKHGLWFVQGFKEGQMVTTIVHESGDTMECGVPMPPMPPKPQEAGSLISYFKRYSLCAAFGLVAEEDDDGNVASGNAYEAANRNGAARNAKIDDAQIALLQTLIAASGASADAFLDYMGVKRLDDLPAAKFADAKAALDQRIARRKEKEPA